MEGLVVSRWSFHGYKTTSIHTFIISLSIQTFDWQAYVPSTGNVINLHEIQPFCAHLKIRNGVNISPLAMTVVASMIHLVSDVEDLC